MKTDSNGNKLWENTFGGANWDYGYSVRQTTDGGYIIAGRTVSYGAGEGDVGLIKTNSSGKKCGPRHLVALSMTGAHLFARRQMAGI